MLKVLQRRYKRRTGFRPVFVMPETPEKNATENVAFCGSQIAAWIITPPGKTLHTYLHSCKLHIEGTECSDDSDSRLFTGLLFLYANKLACRLEGSCTRTHIEGILEGREEIETASD